MLIGSLTTIIACKQETNLGENTGNDQAEASSDSLKYNSDWTFLTHGNADQNYNAVFPQDSVNLIEITMTADRWQSIRTNMKELYGYDFGGKKQGAGQTVREETDYVDITLKFKGKIWKNVGFRLKGNSSLSMAWGQGNYKLPFRLNFDNFEDTYPAIRNQHFYGFKELAFSPGSHDQSLIREKITPDIFRMAGIAAAQTAFFRVYIDFGAGLKYCGVYTAVELPDDNMVKEQFGEEDGNMYKPESRLSTFVQAEFEKKNNETEADYSDVKQFISALNDNIRLTNAQQWRKNLEAVFNVDYFIRYLAVNNAIVNWDSYGNMAHNYYLYNHSVKKLTWIPWDHNEALSGSPGITGSASTPGGGALGGGKNALSLTMNETTSAWPLIKYVATDEVYFAKYNSYLKLFIQEAFTESAIHALIDKYSNMITPYAIGANGEQTGYTYLTNSSSFINANTALKTHVTDRIKLISGYVP